MYARSDLSHRTKKTPRVVEKKTTTTLKADITTSSGVEIKHQQLADEQRVVFMYQTGPNYCFDWLLVLSGLFVGMCTCVCEATGACAKDTNTHTQRRISLESRLQSHGVCLPNTVTCLAADGPPLQTEIILLLLDSAADCPAPLFRKQSETHLSMRATPICLCLSGIPFMLLYVARQFIFLNLHNAM